MENCIIVGAGTYGEVYAEYLKEEYNILGFIDDNPNIVKNKGLNVLGDFNFLLNNIERSTNVFIPIGNNEVRYNLLNKVIKAGFKTPSFIHRNTNIHASVEIGKCVYILSGVNIMPLTKLKDFVLISMGVNIAHHAVIDEGCFISQGSNIGASVYMEKKVFCGIASTIMTGVKNVGENSLIGAGAVIIRDVPDNAVVVGNPGKVIKYNK
ncbi:acetyltransferase [Tenacibaculum larymnensis]|uniref:Acetyltransferase n=1 Tax=Tenacibaculum larymnensis TaxID=2878201 RepID=A0A9X4EQ27_9FLAO|nr:acetyltransferase [Tenacibaculum larymnensis]MDE1208108.1 acetyltransferase [Tenacibaculum larymnensis]